MKHGFANRDLLDAVISSLFGVVASWPQMASKDRLATSLECLPVLRKRFRKGIPWIREPKDSLGENALQTTKAIEINYPILRVVIRWMKTRKISMRTLEPEAMYF